MVKSSPSYTARAIYPPASNAMVHRYSRESVQKAIDADKRIGKREARLIHALLRGRE